MYILYEIVYKKTPLNLPKKQPYVLGICSTAEEAHCQLLELYFILRNLA